MKFHKINKIDDWGQISYIIGNVVKSSAGTISTSSQTSPIVKAGIYTIKWKSGRVEDVKIFTKKVSETINDMGHSYEVTSDIPFLSLDYYGNKIEVELSQLDILIGLK